MSPPVFPFRLEAKVSLGRRSVTGRMLLKLQLGLDSPPVHLMGPYQQKQTDFLFRQNCGFPQKAETWGETI